MTDLQPKLGEVRKLVEAKNDPAYALLLRVVRVKCPPLEVAYPLPEGGHRWRVYDHVEEHCQKCEGTGFVTRSIEGWPIGALRGAIEFAIIDIPGLWAKYVEAYKDQIWKQLASLASQAATGAVAYTFREIARAVNVDHASLDALIEALDD
mgnify:CR=1 FL=1